MPTLAATANDAETRNRLSTPAIKAFCRLAEEWDISVDEQLELLGASIGRSKLYEWRRGEYAPLNIDQITRISYLLAAYEALQRIWRRAPHEAKAWMERENQDHPFLGESPLTFIRVGGIAAMAQLRAVLDAETGGPPSREWYPAPTREG
jgi:hypothetical protein